MSITHPVWTGEEWIEVPIPEMDGEGLVVPNVAAVVYSTDRSRVLLQRRDKPGEAVMGRIEIPGGRWRAGESAAAAVRREVFEESGVSVDEVLTAATRHDFPAGLSVDASRPAVVVAGLEGAYPAVLIVYECIGSGSPQGVPGETAAPSWWPIPDVLQHLEADPDDFVWQSAVVLRELLG